MSLFTRLVGMGLCLLGAFAVGYVQGVQTISAGINAEVYRVLGTTPGFAPPIASMIASYIQQNVTPTLNPYLAVGIALAAGGFVIVVRGDGKPKGAEERGALRPKPVP